MTAREHTRRITNEIQIDGSKRMLLDHDGDRLDFRADESDPYVIVELTMHSGWIGTVPGNAVTEIHAEEAEAIAAFLIERFHLPAWTRTVGG